MKGAYFKLLALRLTILLSLFLICIASAQTSNHSVDISLPNFIGFKIIDDAGKIASNASVDFDFETDIDRYIDAVLAGGDSLEPSSVSEFADIQVFNTRNAVWFIRTRTIINSGFDNASGLALSDITVNPGLSSGLSLGTGFNIRLNTWSLRTNWRFIARGFGSTQGWSSLGFNGTDYQIDIQGDESPQDHSATVIYQLISF